MSNFTLMMIGMSVFTLLLIGLILSAYEFLKASDRPDRLKGADFGDNR